MKDMFDSNSNKLCNMTNIAFISWLWLIERRHINNFIITNRRLCCRR